MRCLDENNAALYLAGKLDTVARANVQEHVASCRECRVWISEAAQNESSGQKPSPVWPIEPEALLAGRYRILKLLGAGGCGEVYAAYDEDLKVQVALKAVRENLSADPRMLERLQREVLAARKVTSPRVCRVFDWGSHEQGGKRIAFFTMQLIEGVTLGERIRRNGPLAEPEALAILRQLVEGLGAAHAVGVVHRDFKSANVLLTPDGQAMVTDFGFAKVTDDEAGSSSVEVGFVGTPAYLAPEQVSGLPVTKAADLYALGIVAYEMLTGRLPFVGQTPVLTAVKRLTDAPTPPTVYAPKLHPSWSRAVLRCLERQPESRFATVEDFLAALEVPPSRRFSRTKIALGITAGALASFGVSFAWQKRWSEPEVSMTPVVEPARPKVSVTKQVYADPTATGQSTTPPKPKRTEGKKKSPLIREYPKAPSARSHE